MKRKNIQQNLTKLLRTFLRGCRSEAGEQECPLREIFILRGVISLKKFS